MTVELTSVICSGPGFKYPPCNALCFPIWNGDNLRTPCECYQVALDKCKSDILVYSHDDVTIHDENWLERVVKLFENPRCVVVGFGGATRLGHPDLYKKPYKIQDMARGGYASNQTDAETHGSRFTGDRRVAVLDAFFMAVRVDWLRRMGGWPVNDISHHCLDLWLGCMAARDEKEVWATGIDCTHHGGGASTNKIYADASWLQGGSLESDHQAPHLWLFRNFSDVLPLQI